MKSGMKSFGYQVNIIIIIIIFIIVGARRFGAQAH